MCHDIYVEDIGEAQKVSSLLLWNPGVDLRLSGLSSKHFVLLTHLASPKHCIALIWIVQKIFVSMMKHLFGANGDTNFHKPKKT